MKATLSNRGTRRFSILMTQEEATNFGVEPTKLIIPETYPTLQSMRELEIAHDVDGICGTAYQKAEGGHLWTWQGPELLEFLEPFGQTRVDVQISRNGFVQFRIPVNPNPQKGFTRKEKRVVFDPMPENENDAQIAPTQERIVASLENASLGQLVTTLNTAIKQDGTYQPVVSKRGLVGLQRSDRLGDFDE